MISLHVYGLLQPGMCFTQCDVPQMTMIILLSRAVMQSSSHLSVLLQVIRAGNMTVRIAGSATNLPTAVNGLPQVVMTPTCENRSTGKADCTALLLKRVVPVLLELVNMLQPLTSGTYDSVQTAQHDQESICQFV